MTGETLTVRSVAEISVIAHVPQVDTYLSVRPWTAAYFVSENGIQSCTTLKTVQCQRLLKRRLRVRAEKLAVPGKPCPTQVIFSKLFLKSPLIFQKKTQMAFFPALKYCVPLTLEIHLTTADNIKTES